MTNKETALEMNKSYGLGVLLKLTKTYIRGIKISEKDGKWAANVGLTELCDAMDMTIQAHNIKIKI